MSTARSWSASTSQTKKACARSAKSSRRNCNRSYATYMSYEAHASFSAFSPFCFGNFRHRLFFVELRGSKPAERMGGETLFEKIAVDRLRRGSTLAGGNDHLAVRRRDAARGIQPRHTRAHALVDFDLAVPIELGAQFLCELVVENV